MSHMGVARDLKAGCKQIGVSFEWKTPSTEPFPSGSNTKTIGVQVNNPEICPRYFGIFSLTQTSFSYKIE